MAVEQQPMINVDLSGKTFLVTGASRGIGKEVAQILGANNANLVLNATNENLLNEVAQSIDASGERVLVVPGDISVRSIKEVKNEAKEVVTPAVPGPGESMVTRGRERWGTIDGAIHVAGINRDGFFFRQSDEDWDAVMAVKLDGARNLFLPAYSVMYRQGHGVLVATTSISGEGNAFQANYAAANMGVEGLLNTLRSEGPALKKPDIRAEIVRLGAVESGMMLDLQAAKPEAVDYFISKMEIGRLISPREAANKIVEVAAGIHEDNHTHLHVFDGGFKRD